MNYRRQNNGASKGHNNKNGMMNRGANVSHDIDDKIIHGIYEGIYFKRKDVLSVKNESEDKARVEETCVKSDETAKDEMKRESIVRRENTVRRENIIGILVIVRILARSNRLTDELVTRYAKHFQLDETIIRLCQEQASREFPEYLHFVENVVE